MNLITLSLSHRHASVEQRERAAFADESLRPALRELTGDGRVAVDEAAILFTCNRTEIYCGANDDDGNSGRRVLDWLGHRAGLAGSEMNAVKQLRGEGAVKHAFRVASGLDSMVTGETEILGQMKRAFRAAAGAGATGKVLNRLFQHTFSVAKQVRTHTDIGANSLSAARVGVLLARQIFARLERQTALLIGAGETIELVARHLRAAGVQRMLIANRSLGRARTVAHGVGGQALALGDVPAHLARADIVVSSTASTLPILGKGAVERALTARRHAPMLILDLAVPRDVEAEVGGLRDVYLRNIDDLRAVVEQNRGLRQQAVDDADAIIDLQAMRFMRWMRSLEAVPVIRRLRGELDATAAAEADKALRRIRAGEDAQAVVQQLASALAAKFAHQPSRALTQAGADGDAELGNAARRLFGLER